LTIEWNFLTCAFDLKGNILHLGEVVRKRGNPGIAEARVDGNALLV